MSTMLQKEELPVEAVPGDGFLEFVLKLQASKSALRRVASGDNPTQSLQIGQIKLYVAGLITLCEGLCVHPVPDPDFFTNSERARCAQRAIDHLEDALLMIEKGLRTK